MPDTNLDTLDPDNVPESETHFERNENTPSQTEHNMPENMTDTTQTKRRVSSRNTRTPKRFEDYVVYK